MGMNDTISDMLTRIRNAIMANKEKVDVLHTRLNSQILAILKDEGYIKNYKHIQELKSGVIRVYLKYTKDGSSAVRSMERVSKPGLRIYVKHKDVKPVRGGHGMAIMSTSKGVLTNKDAVKLCVGGEVLCRVW